MSAETYNVKTSVGTFRVEKTVHTSYSLKYAYDMLKVGGRQFCVELKFNRESPDDAELQWLSTKDGGCEIYHTPIRQKNTQHLLFLSLTLLKSYIDVKRITFLDNSKYECRLSNGSKSIIFMNQYYYLFHGGTWYDLKTGAVPKNPDERVKYEEAKTFFTNPSKKKSFDFRNPSLEKEFGPIYEKAETWREFLDVIYKKRGPDFCEKILPWYSYAAGILADNRLLPGYWVIETITPIPFTRIATTRVAIGGSRRKYKKRTETYDVLSPSELYELAL